MKPSEICRHAERCTRDHQVLCFPAHPPDAQYLRPAHDWIISEDLAAQLPVSSPCFTAPSRRTRTCQWNSHVVRCNKKKSLYRVQPYFLDEIAMWTVTEWMNGLERISMRWIRYLSLFLLCGRRKSVGLRFRDSVSNDLWVVKNHHAPNRAATNSLKFQLLPKNCYFIESERLKRSFCGQFHLLAIQMRVLDFRKSWDQG